MLAPAQPESVPGRPAPRVRSVLEHAQRRVPALTLLSAAPPPCAEPAPPRGRHFPFPTRPGSGRIGARERATSLAAGRRDFPAWAAGCTPGPFSRSNDRPVGAGGRRARVPADPPRYGWPRQETLAGGKPSPLPAAPTPPPPRPPKPCTAG